MTALNDTQLDSMTPMTSVGRTFTPDRTHLLAVALMTGIGLIAISWAPLYLGWVLIFPVVFVLWVLKAHTRVDESGISLTYLFRKNEEIPWEELKGVSFKGMKALATTKNGKQFPLPGVTFNSLPALSEASQGRITDVITEAAEAADGMVEVTDTEGNSVLMTQEEYEAHVQEHAETEAQADKE